MADMQSAPERARDAAPRVERLRAKLAAMDDASLFYERSTLCAEAWPECQWDPPALQTARVFAHVLARMAVVIDPDDLLVGRVAQLVPDAAQEAHLTELGRFGRTLGQWALPERCEEVCGAVLSPQDREAMAVYGTGPGGWRNGHMTPSWPAVVGEGFRRLGARARDRRARVRPDSPDEVRQVEFLTAVGICCEAIVHLAHRYADEAARLALAETDRERQRELRQIAAACRHVPEHPARTFHEALQAVWLVQLVLSTVIGARDYAPGRLDQYLGPLYQRDRAAGRLTREQAQELIDCFFLKLNENIGRGAKRSLCVNSVQYLILGGVTPEGADATNELSWLCLSAVERLRLKQPTAVVRYHPDLPPAFFRRTCEVILQGSGNPSIFNDLTMVPALMGEGIPLEQARDYAVIGCANPNIPGREGALNDHRLNLAKCVELALNDGLCPQTGADSGVRTGDPAGFGTFAAVMAAFLRHVDELIGRWVQRNDLFDRICATCVTDPFLSAIVEGCIESATDCYAGGATWFHTPYQAAGLATAADALVAIRRLVYEERALSPSALAEVLRADFAGREDLRHRLRERYPKFGNDEDEVDAMAARVAAEFCRRVRARPTRWGNGHGNWPGIYSFGQNHIHMGRATGATPDGRRAGTPISFNLSPSPGMARKGPTATCNSVARVDFAQVSGGGTFDLTLDRAVLRDVGTLEGLLRGYLDRGGMQVQLNVVDRDTLLDAQEHSEAHGDLLVRVTGFSAHFTSLDRATQDDIIGRFESPAPDGRGAAEPG
ncbi:MAG: pyruvate formate lyase family protein [Gemmatimonadota bacterium]